VVGEECAGELLRRHRHLVERAFVLGQVPDEADDVGDVVGRGRADSG
jgi:hypothetical protein